jgi:rod shape-determining protein MreD
LGFEFWGRLNAFARGLIPFLLTLLLMLLMLSSTGIPGFVNVAPSMTVISVYFWSIHRPDLMPLYAVFLLGLIEDALAGGPFGIQAIVLVLVASIIGSQRHFFTFAPFGYIYSTFMLLIAGALGLNWLLNCLLAWQLWEFLPLMVKAAMCIVVFPPVFWLLSRIDDNVVSAR